MDLLAEFMPDMGDILAAQEGSFMSVISALTTQLQQLAINNEKQAQRMTYLESTQLSMRLPSPPDPAIIDALATLTAKMDSLQVNVQQQVEEQMQQTLKGLQIAQQIGELRSEAIDSLTEKSKETEEAVKTQLEQLEKRFDYLSR
eukprot:jgi/Phyca11/71926/gw1.26.471.1